MKKQALIVLLAVGALSATVARAGTYDALADFQLLNNPSGVWSYGYSHDSGMNYSMTLFDAHSELGWFKADYVTLEAPTIWVNTTGNTRFGVEPGQLSLHPGPLANGDFAILRFTAPTTGAYAVNGQFFAGDIGNMSGSIVLNGALQQPLQYFADTTNQSVFTPLNLQLHSGATLDFVVGNNGSFYYGNTPLSVTITSAAAVPEPESYAMLLAGLGALGLAARRRRKA